MRRKRNAGFISTEYLLALLAVLLLMPACVGALAGVSELIRFNEVIQDEIAVGQLRNILLTAYDIRYDENALVFTYKKKEMILRQVNDHLILQPGTQIFLSAADRVYFARHDGLVYVVCERGRERSEKVLYKE